MQEHTKLETVLGVLFECQAEKCGVRSVDNWKLGKDLPRSLV